jgi:HSP20 family molecular chaperone IbpA
MKASAQRSVQSFEGLIPKKRPASCRSAAAGGPKISESRRPQAWQEEFPAIEIAEEATEYKIIVPLSGIDPRKIYVFATPRSLLIEIRSKITVPHELDQALVMEGIDHRVSREFRLPVEIEQGGTEVQIGGESLDITARKSERQQQLPWSQLIHFDMRTVSQR